jgi:hypothetical protein
MYLNTLGTGYLNYLYAYKRKSASPVLNVLSTYILVDTCLVVVGCTETHTHLESLCSINILFD